MRGAALPEIQKYCSWPFSSSVTHTDQIIKKKHLIKTDYILVNDQNSFLNLDKNELQNTFKLLPWVNFYFQFKTFSEKSVNASNLSLTVVFLSSLYLLWYSGLFRKRDFLRKSRGIHSHSFVPRLSLSLPRINRWDQEHSAMDVHEHCGKRERKLTEPQIFWSRFSSTVTTRHNIQ